MRKRERKREKEREKCVHLKQEDINCSCAQKWFAAFLVPLLHQFRVLCH